MDGGKRRTLIVVLDGAGDRPHQLLHGKTPLEFAHTPTLDYIASSGVVGLLDVIGGGRIPVSSSGALSILGYDPVKCYPGETMLEALGIDESNIQEGDVAVHVSFATGEATTKLLDRRVCRDLTSAEAIQLARDITNNVSLETLPLKIHLLNYRYYRNVLILKRLDGQALSDQVSNTDPAHTKDGYFDIPNAQYKMEVKRCEPLEQTVEAIRTAEAINEFIHKASSFLSTHPINVARRRSSRPEANLVITRNASGHIPRLQQFNGTLGVIVETPGEKAVGQLLGARLIHHSFLEKPSVDFYKSLSRIALNYLREVDVLYVHTKGPDEPGHDGDPVAKARVLELIDAAFLSDLISHIPLDVTNLVVTSDHATPCELRIHSADPVPLVVMRPGWKPDRVQSFHEGACSYGALGILLGKDLLGMVRS